MKTPADDTINFGLPADKKRSLRSIMNQVRIEKSATGTKSLTHFFVIRIGIIPTLTQ